MNYIAENLRLYRKRLSWTQQELAKQSGINYNTILKLENGSIQNPTTKVMNQIGQALNVDTVVLTQPPGYFLNRPGAIAEKALPIRDLDPETFELMVYWLVSTMYPEENGHHVDLVAGANDGGKDVRRVTEKQLYYYQCKRVQKLSLTEYQAEIDKIISDPHKENREIKLICFAITTLSKPNNVTKQKVREYVQQKLGNNVEVDFWTTDVLDKHLQSHRTVADRFFSIYSLPDLHEKIDSQSKSIDEVKDTQNKIFTNILSNTEGQIKESLVKSSILISKSQLIEARELLSSLLGKEGLDLTSKAKIENNLGVTYNILSEHRNPHKALEHFENSVGYDGQLTTAQINLSMLKIELGSDPNGKDSLRLMNNLWSKKSSLDEKEQRLLTSAYLSCIYMFGGGAKAAIEFIESKQLIKGISESTDLTYMYAGLLVEKGDTEKAIDLIDKRLEVDYEPSLILLKARILLLKVQAKSKIGANYLIPEFEKSDLKTITTAESLVTEVIEVISNKNNPYILEQAKLVREMILVWTGKLDMLRISKVRHDYLNELDQTTATVVSLLSSLVSKDYEGAFRNLRIDSSWDKASNIEKFRIAKTFIYYGAPEQAKTILEDLLKDSDIRLKIDIHFVLSAIEALLEDKISAFNNAMAAEQLAKGLRDEALIRTALSNYAAIARRYSKDHEADRMLKAAFELQEMLPEEKIIWSITPFDHNNELTTELKEILDDQRTHYESIRSRFRSNPIPIYWLEKMMKRDIIEIIETQSDPNFTFDFNLPSSENESELQLSESTVIILDYLSLLDLSQSGILTQLKILGKKVKITRSLFIKIQEELVQHKSEALKKLWETLRRSSEIEIVNVINNEKYDKLTRFFDQWLVDTIALTDHEKGIFLTQDFRLLNFVRSLEIPACNTMPVVKQLAQKLAVDDRAYSTYIGVLASRLYTFIPFNGDNLFNITSADEGKVTLRSYHLINQLLQPGSQVETFLIVFRDFIVRFWSAGFISEDKITWLKILNEKYFDYIDKFTQEIEKHEQIDELTKGVSYWIDMWLYVITNGSKTELSLLKDYISQSERTGMKIIKEKLLKLVTDKLDQTS